MDEMVLEAQEWVNFNYHGKKGFVPAPTNGQTGWSTMYALTRALQIELGIGTPVNNFGDGTATAYRNWGEMEMGSVPTDLKGINIVKILQSAMYCKGYGPGGINGTFGEGTKREVIRLQTDAGLPIRDGKVYDYIFKAFLVMDAYVLVSDEGQRIREMQRDLNYNYYKTSGVQPADGIYQRGTNRALIYGIQTEEGIDPEQQTGSVGPATTNRLPTLSIGNNGVFVKLLQYALYVNGYDPGVFDGVYGNGVKNTVIEFQEFVALTADGIAGKQTWLSLLQSKGDPNRMGTACDCVTEITSFKAQALKDAGYRTVGRYLVNKPGSSLNKKIQLGEIETILNAGLTIYPIYQTDSSTQSYFSAKQGANDAVVAYKVANSYGFRDGTTIYFSVDFDALDYQVTDSILPYFNAIYNKMIALGSKYKIGIYGPRNICIRVGERGYSSSSFVSGMSTGFSGNLGYPLPRDWAFDQISTIYIGTGNGLIEIDNDIQSGRDKGVSAVSPQEEINVIDDTYFDSTYESGWRAELTDQLEDDRTILQWIKGDVLLFDEQVPKALDNLIRYDDLITDLSNIYSMRKSMIQSVMLREMACFGADDVLRDAAVQQYYDYMDQLEAYNSLPDEQKLITPPPVLPTNPLLADDSSTGLSQIFARTAIDAMIYARANLVSESKVYDKENWKDVWDVWENLKNDDTFNVSACALVLIQASQDYNEFGSNYYDYTIDQIMGTLARYNGTGDKATAYGEVVYHLYEILEKYNKLCRGNQ